MCKHLGWMILTRNDSTLLADTYYFVVICHHNVSLFRCDCLVRFSFLSFLLCFCCWFCCCCSFWFLFVCLLIFVLFVGVFCCLYVLFVCLCASFSFVFCGLYMGLWPKYNKPSEVWSLSLSLEGRKEEPPFVSMICLSLKNAVRHKWILK